MEATKKNLSIKKKSTRKIKRGGGLPLDKSGGISFFNKSKLSYWIIYYLYNIDPVSSRYKYRKRIDSFFAKFIKLELLDTMRKIQARGKNLREYAESEVFNFFTNYKISEKYFKMLMKDMKNENMINIVPESFNDCMVFIDPHKYIEEETNLALIEELN